MSSKKGQSSQSEKAMAERPEQHGTGHYKTLVEQFYEALLLLKALSGLRDGYDGFPVSQNLRKERLRNFLRGLAYFCDFKKGGDTYTGIGLEETETEYIFWVTSNKHRPDLADFLRDLLSRLKQLKDAPEDNKGRLRRSLQAMCFSKAGKRISMYQAHLTKSIAEAQSILAKPKTQHDQELSSWMSGLNKADMTYVELCDSIFTASKEHHMLRLLRSRAKFERSLENIRGKRNAFDEVRHYIGRLASHTRTLNQLCDYVEDPLIEEIIRAPVVRQIDPLEQAAEPTYDIHTKLKGLLVGIKDGVERREVESRLDDLNRQCDIFKGISNQYDNFKPRVHAEVQILEHFYRKNLRFANDDKFVGGSKPSCECCYLYFKYHPARMVLPESSHKVFINWSLPPVANQSGDAEFIQQRKILSKMVNVLIYDAISEILDCRTTPCWRPDSLTDLSSTITSFRLMEPDGVAGPS
ncbi:unnamed protein product [Clonostachys rosea f. rosea IK726]|uniref:Uncharacterized protein n=1 Tax=Clonostachys rosea f. rosea IK726 TaxID=1349383 RepID=A0ACA9TI71_BIOOC|nr:unnamed protein product [Clonostachys rosea f. rosea IK726]